jgi:hypothetical protein
VKQRPLENRDTKCYKKELTAGATRGWQEKQQQLANRKEGKNKQPKFTRLEAKV